MYYEVNVYLTNTPDVATLHEMHFRCCSYFKVQADCSRYALAQGIELEEFKRINSCEEMRFIGLS
jgi:hypothetical protein